MRDTQAVPMVSVPWQSPENHLVFPGVMIWRVDHYSEITETQTHAHQRCLRSTIPTTVTEDGKSLKFNNELQKS